MRGLLAATPSIRRICFSTGAGSAKIFKKGNGAWLAEPGAFRCRDDAVSRGVFPKLPVDGDGVELCVMESVSPASNPRQTWSKAKQAAFDDEYAARPAAIYPYKRKHWFEVCFRDEPAVQKAPPFGSVPTDFRPEEDSLRRFWSAAAVSGSRSRRAASPPRASVATVSSPQVSRSALPSKCAAWNVATGRPTPMPWSGSGTAA